MENEFDGLARGRHGGTDGSFAVRVSLCVVVVVVSGVGVGPWLDFFAVITCVKVLTGGGQGGESP